MSKKALVRALKQAGYTLFAERVKSFGKGAFSTQEGPPSFILGELSERLDEDFSYIVKHLAEKEKQNICHSKTLSQAIDMLNTRLSLEELWDGDFTLGYAPLDDNALAWEIYERNTKNPDQSLIEELKKVDVQAGENRTKLAVALKEAGMPELADALPVHLYTAATVPSGILEMSFVWSETKEGHDTWRKAKQTLQNIEQKNETILKDLQKIDQTLKSLNYCKPDTSNKLALYKSKVSVKHADVLTKLEAAEKLKARTVKDLYALNLSEAAEHIEKMEFDLPENCKTSDVLDSLVWKNHKAGFDFWQGVQKKVLQAQEITRTNKENLIKLTKELGHHDKAEALKDIRFDLSSKAYSPARTLMCGFGWHSSPQGGVYWNSLHDELMQAELTRQEKEKEMSMSTPKAKLITALRKVNLPNHANLIEEMDKDFGGETPAQTLKTAFVWGDTDQGHLFWSEAERKLRGLGKLPSWHVDCITRRAELVSALVQIGRDEIAKIVAGLTHERFDRSGKLSEVWACVPYSAVKNETWRKVKRQLVEKEEKASMNTNQKTLIATLKKLGEPEAAAHIEKLDGSIFEHDTPEGMLEFDFAWHETPQGYMFWLGVDARVNGLDKSAEWHDACKIRKTNLIQACFDAGRKDAAKRVKALPYELFNTGEPPVEVAQHIPLVKLDKETRTFWEGLREELVKVSNCTAELSAKKRLIDAVYEVTGRKFETLAELPLSAFSGLTVPTAENLVRAFDWYESEEGEGFWQAVHGKLEARQTVTVTVAVFAGVSGVSGGASGCTAKFVKVEPRAETPHLINMHDTYKTRDGRDVRVLCVDQLDETYKVIALVKTADGTTECPEEYTATGRFYADEQGDDDLVLHSTKDPRDSLKIDDPVYVRTLDSSEWQLRYYAGKTSDGKHSVWTFKQKSTDRTAEQCCWPRWKVNGVELSA